VGGDLRCLCAVHDTQVEKDGRGKRTNDGKPYLQGCDLQASSLTLATGQAHRLNEGQLAPKNLKKSLNGCRGYDDLKNKILATQAFASRRHRLPAHRLEARARRSASW
jgi:hypothetical protein